MAQVRAPGATTAARARTDWFELWRFLPVSIFQVLLPAEAALGWAAATAYALAGRAPLAQRILAALAVSTFYTGALVLAHFLIDVAGWGIAT